MLKVLKFVGFFMCLMPLAASADYVPSDCKRLMFKINRNKKTINKSISIIRENYDPGDIKENPTTSEMVTIRKLLTPIKKHSEIVLDLIDQQRRDTKKYNKRCSKYSALE